MNSPSSKRVVFQVITSLAPAGAERVVLNLLRYHNRERYMPVCICLSHPSGSHYEEAVRAMNIPLYFLGKGERADWNAYKRLGALFRHYRPTIVHTHLRGLTYAYPAMIRYRTPVRIYTVHNLAQYDIATGFNKLIRMLAFRYRLGGVIPVAIAVEVQQSIAQVYGYRNAPLIPNGIALEEYALSREERLLFRQENHIEPQAVVITHIGRFAPQKNHELLIQAFARVYSNYPIYLFLVGDGPLKSQIEHQVRQLGIQQRVRFLGIRTDVPAILNASDIFVLSSRWEGNPMSVMEAMAAGLPVVATAVGGVPELVEHGVSGFLVPSENASLLAEAIQRLVDNPLLRQQMGKAALQRAHEQFDARRMVQAYEALYEATLEGKIR